MTRMTHVEIIRKALAATDRSLSDLARESEIHPVQLSRFKGGKRGLGPQALERLAVALGGELVFHPAKKSRKILD